MSISITDASCGNTTVSAESSVDDMASDLSDPHYCMLKYMKTSGPVSLGRYETGLVQGLVKSALAEYRTMSRPLMFRSAGNVDYREALITPRGLEVLEAASRLR